MDAIKVDMRLMLRAVVEAGLCAVDGRLCVAAELRANPIHHRHVAIVALGKAACPMILGAIDVLTREQLHSGLVVTKRGHSDSNLLAYSTINVLEAGHPVPDEYSLRAGQRVVEFLQQLPRDVFVLFLLSGGTSSLVELLPEGLTLADLRRANEWLLASGLPIADMNCVRTAMSLVKGGQLRYALHGQDARVLLISDVPGDDVRIIGSGPLTESASRIMPNVPSWLAQTLSRAATQRQALDERPCTIEHKIIANLRMCMDACADTARAMDFVVEVGGSYLQGEASEVGAGLARQLCTMPPGMAIWGGETTVTLPPHPGRGGRNQTVALAAAEVIRGRDDVALVAIGTDGSDGPGDDAGAIVDGATIERGKAAGFDSHHALSRADAGTFLAASGDLIRTGPTGTNVMDLIVGVRMKHGGCDYPREQDK